MRSSSTARTPSLRLLLDSHALLWWLEESGELSDRAYAAIRAADNEVAVSAVTAWEIEIKRAAGKLRAPFELRERLEADGFAPLAISVDHAIAAGRLPPHHRDTFDRMLVAQAQLERLTVVTRDPVFTRYGVPVLPA